MAAHTAAAAASALSTIGIMTPAAPQSSTCRIAPSSRHGTRTIAGRSHALAASTQAEETPTLSGLNFKKGDQVKITSGSFENFEGDVDSVDEKRGMVTLIVEIFGRSTPVEVEYWQLEKVE